MSSLWLELRLAARKLSRRPGFSAAVILLVALGVGDDVPVSIWLPVWKRPLVTGRPRSDMERIPDNIHTFLVTMGRLAPGSSIVQAQSNLDLLGRQLTQAHEIAQGECYCRR